MELNRQQRRIAKKQGLLDDQGEPVRERRERSSANRGGGGTARTVERTSPGDYVKEVRSELRKVAWPSREEVINYSIIVGVLVIVLTLMIAALDFGFGEAILALFDRR